jgi:hypothetical protein
MRQIGEIPERLRHNPEWVRLADAEGVRRIATLRTPMHHRTVMALSQSVVRMSGFVARGARPAKNSARRLPRIDGT